MKKIFFFLVTGACLLSVLFPAPLSRSENSPTEPAPGRAYFGEFILGGSWEAGEKSIYPPPAERKKEDRLSVDEIHSRTYFVDPGPLPPTDKRIGYGGALNLKYYSGISYDYLQNNLPGKTISVDILMPEGSLSSFKPIPNKLRITIKSEKDGEWAEYYGKKEWISVKEAGKYNVRLEIPEKAVPAGAKKTFYPENTVLFAVDYYLMEGSKRQSYVLFSFSDFSIEGIDLDPDDLKWQFTKNGYALEGVYLPYFVKGSTLINSMGEKVDLEFKKLKVPEMTGHASAGNIEELFLSLPVFIPKELRAQKGTLALTVKGDSETVRSCVKDFSSCNLEGMVFLTLPLDAFDIKENIKKVTEDMTIGLRIKTLKPHAPDMMPIVLGPLKIKQGQLVPFDKNWRVRDVQGLGGYKKIDVRQDGLIGEGGITAAALESDLYQLDMTTRLRGGIDWQNPLYRVELMRDFDPGPVDLDNIRVEVFVSPLTDTTDAWQKPFRARVGLLDVNDNVMFGPNVSLSEGLPSIACLDVSTTNPLPKGLVMPGFDAGKVKAILINLEASHGKMAPRDINISFADLAIRPREYTRPGPLKSIDFSRFKRDPGSWQITGIIGDTGGYVVGINYPFPVIDVPEEVLKVPHVYPGVGMKPNDPMHLGFSSEITRKTIRGDFEKFVHDNINIVRLFVLGHLGGVFTWDEKGKDISGFGEGMESLVQDAAGMSVERFAEFLNKNEDRFFLKDTRGHILGLEEHVIDDFTALLDILEQIEKDTGKKLVAILSLYDFMIGDGVKEEGPFRLYTVGEHPEVVTDPLTKVKAQALLWKIMKILSRDERFYRYIAVVEIMNEPANATDLATKKDFVELLNFVGEGLYLLKDALGPSMPVSVGFRSWAEDLRYWAPIAGGVDILMVHYWESLESYNIDSPALWPLDMPAKRLWAYLGAKKQGRLTGMGEISPGGDFRGNLFRLEKAGYDFSLVWSYSGHDGHNAKPVMDEIAQYQVGNYKFAKLKKMPREYVRHAFLYILTARELFIAQRNTKAGSAGNDPTDPDSEFFSYLSGRAKNISDEKLRYAVEEILLISMLKGIPLNRGNIKFLLLDAVSGRQPRSRQ